MSLPFPTLESCYNTSISYPYHQLSSPSPRPKPIPVSDRFSIVRFTGASDERSGKQDNVTMVCDSFSVSNHASSSSGVHEPPKAAKEHLTSKDMLCALMPYTEDICGTAQTPVGLSCFYIMASCCIR